MSAKRLEQLRDYADALACRAYLTGVGSQKDLNEIVNALEELIALKAMETAHVQTYEDALKAMAEELRWVA